MKKKRPTNKRPADSKGITSISVVGYKSLRDKCKLEIRPLTILAGANSSGKSSAMQPLLLLKQTLDTSYDPGPLQIDGANVRLTTADQLFYSPFAKPQAQFFSINIELAAEAIKLSFKRDPKGGLMISEEEYTTGESTTTLRPSMKHDEIVTVIPKYFKDLADEVSKKLKKEYEWTISRMRCFLQVDWLLQEEGGEKSRFHSFSPTQTFIEHIRDIIHLPGLRGNPERTYKTTAVGKTFPGDFNDYVASVINLWQRAAPEHRRNLNKSLEMLGLTWKVKAKPISDTQVELEVGRLTHCKQGGAYDLVNIADVGFGTSQTLPVLVALEAARPGQLVYIEQPEIHLHPRAQVALAKVLANTAKRGAKVVIETHSALLLRGVQSLVAQGNLPSEIAKLHWFERDKDGITHVTSADFDEKGAFGDWPEDFGKVELEAESSYLDAVDRYK